MRRSNGTSIWLVRSLLVLVISFVCIVTSAESGYKNITTHREDQRTLSGRAHFKTQYRFVPSGPALFYEVFTNSTRDVQRVKKIMNEQLKTALTSPSGISGLHITSVKERIPPVRGAHMNYVHEYSIMTSLQYLFEYCVAHPDKKVMYLHNRAWFRFKGDSNIALRNFNTYGAASRDCANLPDDCHVCSSRFSPFPHPHTPGNMWMARCSYVSELIPPKKFAKTMKAIVKDDPDTYCREEVHYNIDRWVYSHPSGSFCDLSSDDTYQWGHDYLPMQSDLSLGDVQRAPRFPIEVYNADRKMVVSGCGSAAVQQAVRLDEYATLYDEFPGAKWWGWDFFREETRAAEALHQETQHIALVPSGPALFYNVYINSTSDVRRVQRIVDEQLTAASRAGISELHITSIKVPLAAVPGARMTYVDDSSEMSTLQHLFEYCVAHPDKKVIYLHSKGSYNMRGVKNGLLRHFNTRGATSPDCVNLPDDCHVCSSRFSPFPHPHSPGNMWLARCSYVSKLIPPERFEQAMNASVDDQSEGHCRGIRRFASEHWVHSHPSGSFCDLLSDESYQWGYDNLPRRGNWSLGDVQRAPRFHINVYEEMRRGASMACGSAAVVKQDVRLEEYKALYGESPGAKWWGWEFFGNDIWP